jgi:tetratricopeptide (TPR) repeat protein
MDRRKWLLGVSLLLLSMTGCMWGNSHKTAKVDPPPTPEVIPDNVVITKKKEDGSKKPSANLVCKIAVMREGQGDKSQEPDVKTRFYDDARRNYQEALKLDPNHFEAQQGLGRIYVKLRDYDHAADAYKKAIAKNPKNAALWVDLAMACNQKKDHAEAVKCLGKALELDPENRNYMKTMGFTLARAGRPDQALPYLTRAMGEAGAHYNLARMLLHLHDVEQGRQHLVIALRVNPDLEPARQLLATLERPAGTQTGSQVVDVEFESPGQ